MSPQRTGPVDALRGPTPRPPRPSVPHPTPPDLPSPVERPSLAAELSSAEEMLRQVLAHLDQRTASDESLVSARAGELARGKTRTYRGALGALLTVLVGLVTWGAGRVQAYGDERAASERAAIEADAKATAAAHRSEQAEQRLEDTVGRVSALEHKVDRVLELLEGQAQPARAVDDPPPTRVRR